MCLGSIRCKAGSHQSGSPPQKPHRQNSCHPPAPIPPPAPRVSPGQGLPPLVLPAIPVIPAPQGSPLRTAPPVPAPGGTSAVWWECTASRPAAVLHVRGGGHRLAGDAEVGSPLQTAVKPESIGAGISHKGHIVKITVVHRLRLLHRRPGHFFRDVRRDICRDLRLRRSTVTGCSSCGGFSAGAAAGERPAAAASAPAARSAANRSQCRPGFRRIRFPVTAHPPFDVRPALCKQRASPIRHSLSEKVDTIPKKFGDKLVTDFAGFQWPGSETGCFGSGPLAIQFRREGG